VLAYVLGDFENGVALIERGLQLNLNLSWGWLFSGWVHVFLGEPEIGLEHITRAMRLSPQDPQIFDMQTGAAYALFSAGRYDEALSWAQKALRERPHYPHAMRVMVASLGMMGQHDQAAIAVARLRALLPELRISNLRDVTPRRRSEDIARLEEGLRRAGLPE
jgi:tetratricopeptide (TPR) repeat protein